MACEAEGVKDTAAIRVAATLLPEGIVGQPVREGKGRRKALFVGIQYANTEWCPKKVEWCFKWEDVFFWTCVSFFEKFEMFQNSNSEQNTDV